jgi:hypothetical protein
MFSSRRNHYMARISIFLITIVLIAGLVGCVGGDGNDGGESYTLTINSTAGGTVIVDNVPIPGKAMLTYDPGTEVSLIATPSAGYRFVEWTGNASTIADMNAVSTTIMMNDNYSITANFIAQYVLTIDSTDGGHVATPGEGTFTYDAGAVVDLIAEAEEGYKFLNWTGDIDTVTDVNAVLTTVTMESDYVVTANFIPEHMYSDRIGPGLWGLGIGGQGIEAAVTEKGVVVNITSDPVDNPEAEPEPSFGAGGYCTYLLKGDFDVRVDYELITWPPGSGVRVGLSVGIPDISRKFMNVERVGWGSPEWPDLPFREVYLVNFEDQIRGITSTDDLSGTLRICRQADTLIGYYSTPEGWHELYRAEWSTEDVYVWASSWSHEYLFGGQEVSVLLRTVEFVEPLP